MEHRKSQATGQAMALGHDQLATMRGAFLQQVYGHLAAAIALFVLIQVLLYQSGAADAIARTLLGYNWLLVLGGFVVVGWLGRSVAYRATSISGQYGGLALYVVGQSIIFVPLLFMARQTAPSVIQSAAAITLIGFTLLTMLALSMRHDFSFLGGLLKWAGLVALLAIVGGVFFDFVLGTWFSVAMIGLAGASVLYDTQKILVSYPDDRYVGAALELFAGIALMFWYVLRLLMGSRR